MAANNTDIHNWSMQGLLRNPEQMPITGDCWELDGCRFRITVAEETHLCLTDMDNPCNKNRLAKATFLGFYKDNLLYKGIVGNSSL